MADVEQGNRPLSPHLTVYRWPLNAVMSIMHRATGAALGASGVLITWWFLALSISEDYFATVDALMTSWFGDIVLLLSLIAIWYHFVHGIRHLVWDTGSSYGKKRVLRSGQVGIATALVLVIATIIIA